MTPEQVIVTNLRTVLKGLPVGADISKSEHFSKALSGLERFVPPILGEIYPEWNGGECLDGIIPFIARKSTESEIELFGLCWLMKDQTQTPVHLRIQIFHLRAVISFLECKLGERGEHGMLRMKGGLSEPQQYRRLRALEGRENAIDWVYKVTFGSRNPK